MAQTIFNIVGAGNGTEYSPACCEGLASQATADQACADHCQRLICEAARSNHLDLAASDGVHTCNDWVQGSPNCGFDMDDCLTGTWHKQTLQFVLSSTDYFMQAKCDNARTNEPSTDDVFNWREVPLDDPSNNPSMCTPPSDPELNPAVAYNDDLALEASGMTAAVTFTLGSSTYTENSSDSELRFAYDLHDCPTYARCIDLAELHISLPTMVVQGVTIENANLVVYQVDTQPALQSTGGFSYAPGTIHAIMSASADGIPIMLRGSNSATATGYLFPGSDALTLSGLTFDYSDSVIAANLQVDIVGDYTVRGPTAVIIPASVPILCTDPVVFVAASSDPDTQSLNHVWWVPGVLTATGSTLAVVLANGTHTIGLISQDADKRLDAGAIKYTRTCR